MGRGLLLIVSGFIIIFGLVQNAVQNRQQVLAERSPNYFYEQQTANIAATMLEVAIGKLNEAPNNATLIANQMDGTSEEVMGADRGTGYIYTEDIQVFGSRIIVRLVGEIEKPDGSIIKSSIKAELNRQAFSIYSYFTDEEPTIYFGTGDVINGPVHTNGTFNMRGEPEFNGFVTSPNMWEDGPYNAEPQFNQGSDFGADEVPFPEEATDAPERAEENGLKYDEKIRVEFKSDGTADITEFRESIQQQCVYFCDSRFFRPVYRDVTVIEQVTQSHNLSDPNFNGVISSDQDVEVKGTVNGQFTLHSKKNINIIGDVRYENRNYDDPDAEGGLSDDLLGIISDGKTLVDRYAHQDHGNTDLDIDATIMTLGESFEVEGVGLLGNRGDLNILGGLIQKKRGVVGQGSGVSISHGYNKNYTYDTRFLTNSTEGFPRQERFQIDYWEETTCTQKPGQDCI